MKLHTKLYLFFAGIVILPLVVVTIVSSVVLGRSGKQMYEARMQSGLAAATAIISGQQQALAGDLKASLPKVDTGALLSGGAARDSVLESLRKQIGAESMTLKDPSGKLVARAGAAGGSNEPAGEGPLLTASVRLGGEGPFTVTALRRFDPTALNSVFSSEDVQWAFVSLDRVVGGSLAPGTVFSGAPADLSGSAAFDARMGDSDVLAAAVQLPGNVADRPLEVVAAVPGAAAGAAASQVLEAGLGLMVLTLGLAAALGFFLARNITGPLRQVTAAAAAGSRGKLDQTVDIKSKDEIGSLAVSFNQMQVKLKDQIQALEESRSQMLLALSYAGEILGSTTDRTRLIHTTAEAARLATGARGVWAQLFGSNRPPGHGAIFAGVPEAFFQEEEIRLAEGFARRAVGSEGSLEPERFTPGTIAAAFPMVHDRAALGCVVAVFEHGRSPEEGQLRILSSLATQAASALENVNFWELQQLLAITDPLTNLSNFRFLKTSLRREIKQSCRYDRPLSVAILDLDDFKAVNDTYGHQAGDELLKAVAAVLSERVRGADMVARYGGEEFAVVLPETSRPAALLVAEHLRRGVEDIWLPGFPGVHVTASIGLATFPGDAQDDEELIGKADEALYRAKGAGKNRSVAFSG